MVEIFGSNVGLEERHPGEGHTYQMMHLLGSKTPLKRNLGKYQLPHIWDGVLKDMLALSTVIPPFHILTIVIVGPPIKGVCTHHLVSMALPGVPPPPHPYWHQIFPSYFGTKTQPTPILHRILLILVYPT